MAPLFLPGRSNDDSSLRKKTRQGKPYRADLISSVSESRLLLRLLVGSSGLGLGSRFRSADFQVDHRAEPTNLGSDQLLIALIGCLAEPGFQLLQLDFVLTATFFFAISFSARHGRRYSPKQLNGSGRQQIPQAVDSSQAKHLRDNWLPQFLVTSLTAYPHADDLVAFGATLSLAFNLQFSPRTDRHLSILSRHPSCSGPSGTISKTINERESLAGAAWTRKPTPQRKFCFFRNETCHGPSIQLPILVGVAVSRVSPVAGVSESNRRKWLVADDFVGSQSSCLNCIRPAADRPVRSGKRAVRAGLA